MKEREREREKDISHNIVHFCNIVLVSLIHRERFIYRKRKIHGEKE